MILYKILKLRYLLVSNHVGNKNYVLLNAKTPSVFTFSVKLYVIKRLIFFKIINNYGTKCFSKLLIKDFLKYLEYIHFRIYIMHCITYIIHY